MTRSKPGSPQLSRRIIAYWIAGLCLLLLIASYGVDLWADPPLLTPCGVFLTDEGWYSKSARHWVLHGQWPPTDDFSPITHTFLQVWLQIAVFRLAGTGLWILRAVTAGIWVLSTGILLRCIAQRESMKESLALWLCLLGHPLLWTFGRFAIADPLALSATAIVIGTHTLALQNRGWDLVALIFALAAALFKLSYAFVIPAVALAMLWREFQRAPKQRAWLWTILSIVGTFGLFGLTIRLIANAFPLAWKTFSDMNVHDRMVHGPLEWLLNIGEMIAHDLWHTGMFGLALGLIYLGLRRQLAFQSDPRLPILGFILLGGWLQRSILAFHRPRYAIFVALVLSIATWIVVAKLRKNRDFDHSLWIGASLLWAAGQGILAFRAFDGQKPSYTLHHSAQEVVQTIQEHQASQGFDPKRNPKTVILGRGEAAMISLYNDHFEVVELSSNAQTLCRRIKNRDPSYLFIDQAWSTQWELKSRLNQCPKAAYDLQKLGQWQVLDNYFHQGPWTLYALTRES